MLFAIIGGGGLLRSVNGMMLAGGDPAYEEYVKAAGIDGKKDWQVVDVSARPPLVYSSSFPPPPSYGGPVFTLVLISSLLWFPFFTGEFPSSWVRVIFLPAMLRFTGTAQIPTLALFSCAQGCCFSGLKTRN